MHAIEKAVAQLGLTQLAGKLGVSTQRICNWRSRESVPPEFCLPIEEVTGGKVTRYELAPEIFGKPQRKAA